MKKLTSLMTLIVIATLIIPSPLSMSSLMAPTSSVSSLFGQSSPSQIFKSSQLSLPPSIFSIPNAAAQQTYELVGGDTNHECEAIGGTWDGISVCKVTNLTVNAGDTLSVDVNVVLWITGTLTVSGTINISGNMFVYGTTSTINTLASINISQAPNGAVAGLQFDSGNNINYGTITTSGYGELLINNYLVNPPPTFANNGSININTNGQLVNYIHSTFINNGIINDNFPTPANCNGCYSFANDGTFTNNAGATITNNGALVNFSDGNISNYGIITNNSSGTITNDGIFTNYCGSTFTNNGAQYGNAITNVCVDPTSTTVSPNPSSVIIGNTITFKAMVTDTSSSPTNPTGTVSFNDGNPSASGSFGAVTCTSVSNNELVCSVAYTPPSTAGLVTINAMYPGDSTHSSSSGISSLSVHTSSQAIQNLLSTVNGMHLKKGITDSLDDKLEEIIKNLAKGHGDDVKEKLNAFIHEVMAQTGKSISPTQAAQLTSAAQEIINVLPADNDDDHHH